MRKTVKTLLAIALALSFTAPAYAGSVSDLKKKQDDIQKKAEQAKEELRQTKNQKTNAAAQLDEADAELEQATMELEATMAQLEATTALYERTQAELAEAEAEKDRQREVFKKRARFMYMRGKSGYLDIIFNAKDFSDMVNRMEYINRIVTYDRGLFDRLQAAEELVATKLDETKRQKQEIQILANAQSAKTEALEEIVLQKQQVVRQLEADQARYNEMIQSLDKEGKAIEALIRQAQAPKRASGSSGGSTGGGSVPYTGGKLGWPVSGGGTVTSGYGGRRNPISKKGEFHTGVDIGAKHGTPIVAAEGGVVISAGTRGGYGKTIIVDHGNGLSTMYAHCSSFSAQVGQTVSRGETIARVGSTGYSTGPHLHFQVMVGGGHSDPMNYLRP